MREIDKDQANTLMAKALLHIENLASFYDDNRLTGHARQARKAKSLLRFIKQIL